MEEESKELDENMKVGIIKTANSRIILILSIVDHVKRST